MKQLTIANFHPKHSPYFYVIAALIIGSLLRVIYPEDMEWKADEIWNYTNGEALAHGQIPFTWVGMPSSAKVLNPGFSLWIFTAFGWFSASPIEMVQWVMWLNVAALWAMFGFVIWQILEEERSPWLWGLAIVAVNPLSILFSRQIWTTDLLPPLAVLTILGHWFRRHPFGAGLWGLMGTMIGQLHMSGFFYGAGLFLWTVWRDYKENRLTKTAWKAWAIGTILGLIPFAMWLRLVIDTFGGAGRPILSLLFPKFYLQWIVLGLGTNLSYSLGKIMWSHFIQEPLIFGQPTYLIGIAHLILVAIGLKVLIPFIRRKPLNPPVARSLDFYFNAMGIGMGGLITLSMLNIPPHYVVAPFPFIHVWWATHLQNRWRSLVALILLQLFISVAFIAFIHRTGGFADSGYGVTYRIQMQQKH
ncbi:hypothetical protein [Leptolyngbya sp. FACHB-17]|uniref:hypothetical protein n=1 Tax=unclassified Leptolyngbya TaxID=2650499 RepID=UPI001681B59A|nr:hypothetical protein [Leptolyngbya sp. FACHB-17]MBD2080571.1 hypothetical protein [Leptolyngbya sp. FACHB-17]